MREQFVDHRVLETQVEERVKVKPKTPKRKFTRDEALAWRYIISRALRMNRRLTEMANKKVNF